MIQAKPMEVYVPEETTGCRYHVWRLVTSPPFENFIMLLIVLNTLLLMLKVYLVVVYSVAQKFSISKLRSHWYRHRLQL